MAKKEKPSKLMELVKGSKNFEEALRRLEGKRIKIRNLATNQGENYHGEHTLLKAGNGFLIIRDSRLGGNIHYLQPIGSNIGYSLEDEDFLD